MLHVHVSTLYICRKILTIHVIFEKVNKKKLQPVEKKSEKTNRDVKSGIPPKKSWSCKQ